MTDPITITLGLGSVAAIASAVTYGVLKWLAQRFEHVDRHFSNTRRHKDLVMNCPMHEGAERLQQHFGDFDRMVTAVVDTRDIVRALAQSQTALAETAKATLRCIETQSGDIRILAQTVKLYHEELRERLRNGR